MSGPLEGLNIVDLTANMSGPYATMVLGDQGADVIKIEPPGGEVIRRVGTGRDGLSVYFANLNRSKRSVVVDLQTEAGVEVVRRVVDRADAVVQNFRPGVMERLGLGPDELCRDRAGLIYVSISGYGLKGPLLDEPAYDHVVQAISGMAALQKDSPSSDPSLVRHGLVDKATGLMVAQAILAAWVQRARTGRGAQVEISMLDVALHFLWPDGMMNQTCLDPVDVLPPISRGFRLTRTADGFVSLITVTDHQWAGLITSVGLDDRLEDPELKGIGGRMRSGASIMREVAAKLAELSTEEAVRCLREHDVPCSSVVELDEVQNNDQVRASETIQEHSHPVLGRIVQPRPPARFLGQQEADITPAPEAGADTDRVLAEHGFTHAEILQLRAVGAIE